MEMSWYMIKNDVRGIFFSVDAALALMVMAILLSTVLNINLNCYIQSYKEIQYFHDAQDTAEIMTVCKSSNGLTVLEDISQSLSEESGGQGFYTAHCTADSFLKKILGKKKYCLTEINCLKGKEICSNGKLQSAKNVGVAVKGQGKYLYKLYVWE